MSEPTSPSSAIRLPTIPWVRAVLIGGLVAVAALIACLAIRRIWELDYWWQWATGRWISEHGIPSSEPFSYTEAGKPWVEVRWLYCLALYHLEQFIGPGGLILTKTAMVLATFGLSGWLAARRAGVAVACLLVAIAATGASLRFFVRPETLSYLLFAVFVTVIALARERRTRLVWALPVIQVLWTNTHSMFPLGPAAIGAWLVTELWELRRPGSEAARVSGNVQRAGILLGLTILACLANPYGYKALFFALNHYTALHATAQKGFFVELNPLFSVPIALPAVQFFYVLLVLALIAAGANWRRPDMFWLLLGTATLYLSLSAMRNMPLFAIVAPVWIASNYERFARQRAFAGPPDELIPAPRQGAIGVLLILFSAYQCWQLTTDRFTIGVGDTNQFGLGIASHRAPVDAVRTLKEMKLDGPVFHGPNFGSYLIAQGIPVFIDPRGEIYQDRMIGEYWTVASKPDLLPEYSERYRFEALLVSSEDLGLIARAANDAAWRLVYLDSEAAIFLQRDAAPATPSLNPEAIGDEWVGQIRAQLPLVPAGANSGIFNRLRDPAPYRRLARALFTLGRFDLAIGLFEDADRLSPGGLGEGDRKALAHARGATASRREAGATNPPKQAGPQELSEEAAHLRAARTAFNAGRLDEALREAENALMLNPLNTGALSMKGATLLRQENFAAARLVLAKAVQLDPTNPAVLKNLGRVQFVLGEFADSKKFYNMAWQADPNDVSIPRDMAMIEVRAGNAEGARLWLDRGEAIAPDDKALKQIRTMLESAPPGAPNPAPAGGTGGV